MFLEVLTRTMGNRPSLLLRNVASLHRQSDPDWKQTFLHDPARRGVAESHRMLAAHQAAGEWVWVLDDDDVCIYADLVAGLRRIAAETGASAVFVRMDHGEPLGILPDDAHWGQAPAEGRIGCSAVLVRRDAWEAYRHAWGLRYAGDFDFIDALWHAGLNLYWWDIVASRTQRGRLIGAGE